MEHIVPRAATGLTNIIRSSYTTDVTSENIWTFELGVKSGIDVPIHKIVGFMQREQFNLQQKNDTFYRPTAVNAQCITVSEKYPDAEKNFTYDVEKNQQAHGEIVSCFRHSAQDNISKPNITQKIL